MTHDELRALAQAARKTHARPWAEHVIALLDEINALKAERDAARRYVGDAEKAMVAAPARKKAEAERDRYREALEEIASTLDEDDDGMPDDGDLDMRVPEDVWVLCVRVARIALSETVDLEELGASRTSNPTGNLRLSETGERDDAEAEAAWRNDMARDNGRDF